MGRQPGAVVVEGVLINTTREAQQCPGSRGLGPPDR
jgi:hypothetical protein